MSIQVQIRQGLASENATFIGAEGELVYTTDTKDLFVHDGSTAGGTPVGSLASIADDSVTFAKIEEIPANTILGNNTGSSSDILELSVAQTQTLLNLKNRANHTGAQTASTISDFNTAAASAAPVQTSDIADFETTTQLNTRDTNNRSRANHTGTQTASTISDFDTEVANNSAVAANTAKISYTDSAAVALNTAKVTNATHTGDVTGATALTIANGVVDSDKLSTTLDFGSIA